MSQESFKIALPLPPKVLSPNWTIGSIGSRFARAAAGKRYERLAQEAIAEMQIETMPWQKISVDVVFFHKVKRKRDEDNAMGSLKKAYDGIVAAGLAVDDDWVHMSRGIPEFKTDKENPRVELTLTRGDPPNDTN